ncbi:MAG: DNA alkylation repair protein [Polyangiaceae bacterium]
MRGIAKHKSRYLKAIRAELVRVADPKRAPLMQAYMKSVMPYHGVASADVKAVSRKIFQDLKMGSEGEWQEEVRAIFHGSKFREEKYVATALLHHKAAAKFRTMNALPLYEELIVAASWWDIVDDLAAHAVGALFDVDAKAMARAMKQWSKSGELWKRRTSIMCQVLRHEKTDLDLMYACIEPSLDQKDFWSRKAIGWALRAYAWTDPKEIARYVKANEQKLSALSKREALKNIVKGKSRPRIARKTKAISHS